MGNLLAFFPVGLPDLSGLPSMPTSTGFYQTMNIIGIPLIVIFGVLGLGAFLTAVDNFSTYGAPAMGVLQLFVMTPICSFITIWSILAFIEATTVTEDGEVIQTTYLQVTIVSDAEITEVDRRKDSQTSYTSSVKWDHSGEEAEVISTHGFMNEVKEGDRVCQVVNVYTSLSKWQNAAIPTWIEGECPNE